MFGRMSAMPFVRLDAGKELEVAVAELLAATDYPEIARWIQLPRGLMLFLMVPGDRTRSQKPEVRKRHTEAEVRKSGSEQAATNQRSGVGKWHRRHDGQPRIDGGYSLTELEVLLGRCYFLRLVENPRCLRRSEWFLTPGQVPQVVASRC